MEDRKCVHVEDLSMEICYYKDLYSEDEAVETARRILRHTVYLPVRFRGDLAALEKADERVHVECGGIRIPVSLYAYVTSMYLTYGAYVDLPQGHPFEVLARPAVKATWLRSVKRAQVPDGDTDYMLYVLEWRPDARVDRYEAPIRDSLSGKPRGNDKVVFEVPLSVFRDELCRLARERRDLVRMAAEATRRLAEEIDEVLRRMREEGLDVEFVERRAKRPVIEPIEGFDELELG